MIDAAFVELLGPELVEAYFPNGVSRYVIGGVLVGFATAMIYFGTAITAGASTFLESTLSYVSDRDRFKQYRPSRDWRVVFTVGIIGGAAVYALIYQGDPWAISGSGWTTEVSVWRLFVGGILVGIGTRIGKGCTSGHGICGVGSVSRTSLVGVATFLVVAIVTANLVAALGVGL